MRYKFRPKDFAVEEQMQLRFASHGGFAVYRLRKRGVAALRVRAQIARALNVPQSDVIFPALKDKDAITVQYIAVRGAGPPRLSGDGFDAEFLGRSQRPLTPADIVANCFTIALRDLSDDEVKEIPGRLAQVSQSGLPNYFDQQRFGSVVPGEDHIARCILRRDAEGALHVYLTRPFVGDPTRVRDFKAFANDHWGDWGALFEAAPRPSNYRSVLTYLRDHPVEVSTGPEPSQGEERAIHYRKALNLINRRLLSIYLSAYQSLLWNRVVGRYLEARLGQSPGYLEIAGERLPVYHTPSSYIRRHSDGAPSSYTRRHSDGAPSSYTRRHSGGAPSSYKRRHSGGAPSSYKRRHSDGAPSSYKRRHSDGAWSALLGTDVTVPLPSYRAVYDDPAQAEIVAQVLAGEGLVLSDLKARILKRAYLSKGRRRLILFPQDASVSHPESDEHFPGRHKLTLTFTLPRGSYATLVIKTLQGSIVRPGGDA